MIIHYSTKVKKFSKKCICEYEQTENFNFGKCPNCNSNTYIRWGNYERNIVYFKNGKKYENTIKIKRIRCNNCGKTHAIIPAFLVPYKVHTLEYIIEVVKYKLVHKNNSKMVTKYSVSRQLIDYWNNCYKKHFTRVCTTLENNNSKKAIRMIVKDIYDFINNYFKRNNIVFMMYIYNGCNKPILKWAPT